MGARLCGGEATRDADSGRRGGAGLRRSLHSVSQRPGVRAGRRGHERAAQGDLALAQRNAHGDRGGHHRDAHFCGRTGAVRRLLVVADGAHLIVIEMLMMTETAANMAKKWYVVHTYSGHENKARLALQERIKTSGLNEKFGDVLIPTE